MNSFINFPLAIFLAFTAKEIVAILLGDKWMETVPFIQLLSIAALVNHFSSINLNLFKVIGRSDLNLKVSILGKILATLAIIIGINFGIWGLVIASVIVTYLEGFICMYYASKNIKYPLWYQIKDAIRNILLVIPLVGLLITFSFIDFNSDILKFVCMTVGAFVVYLLTAYFLKSKELHQFRGIIVTFMNRKKANN